MIGEKKCLNKIINIIANNYNLKNLKKLIKKNIEKFDKRD